MFETSHTKLDPFYLPRPLVFAHRGASAIAPENTLAAFQAAMDVGADGIELDVTRCATGEVVVMHDATVDRTTDGHGRVGELPLAALRELDAGAWFGREFAGQRVPLLEEVLDLVGGRLRINIEIKAEGSGQGLEEALAEQVIRRGLQGSVLVSSFHPPALRRLRQAARELPRALLLATPLSLSLAWWRNRHELYLQAFHPQYRLVNAHNLARMRRAGLRANVWTVNQEEDMLHMIALGVDGIITDRPDRLRALLPHEGF
ncbi:MAG: glycerophosphodiester phosphodiesterase [Chloroflexi bacterium]|nr:glycerophosphodiester phosphodiesterase [Chloroflexota bacterium]